MKLENADFKVYAVSNKEMEKIRRALLARADFTGREAQKISTEETVSVLAFPEPGQFPHPETKKKFLGEVYLNQDFGSGKWEVLGPLFIHGFLHLLGYRHSSNRDTMKMQKLERALWETISSA